MVLLCQMLLCAIAALAKTVLCEEEERKLYEMVLGKQSANSKLARPVLKYEDVVNVTVGVNLQQIIEIDEKAQVIQLNMWLTYKWNDYNFQWNPEEYGGIQSIRIPPSMMWKPDVLLYNSVDESFDSTYPSNVVVQHDGSMEWIPPGIIKCTCKIDITWFPFDDQRCPMKFGSWTYSGLMLDLQAGVIDTSTYTQNGEWALVDVESARNEFKYDCCPEPYIDVTFTLWVRRRTLYYGFNLIIPCLLIAFMTLLGFTLPPDSGEKLSLGVTIFMSLIVFLLMVAESMPPTSEAVPLIGIFFSSIMISVAVSVAFTVLVLNFHHRTPDTHSMSAPVRAVFLNWLPWMLWMERPGYTAGFCRMRRRDSGDEDHDSDAGSCTALMNGSAAKNTISRSLLANIKDTNDSSIPFQRLSHELSLRVPLHDKNTPDEDVRKMYQAVVQPLEPLLGRIYKEMRFMTRRMREEDEANQIINDWKFAAMVVDRLSLVLFTSILLLTTGGILFSAPHILA